MSHGQATCPICGTEFTKRTYNQKHCDPRCKKRAYRKSQNSEIGQQSYCKICSTQFTIKQVGQVFCSPACREENTKRKKKKGNSLIAATCKYCGGRFDTELPYQKYCKPVCQQLDHKKEFNNTRFWRGGGDVECSRKCHDCGEPTNDFRCKACWDKLGRENDTLEVEDFNCRISI